MDAIKILFRMTNSSSKFASMTRTLIRINIWFTKRWTNLESSDLVLEFGKRELWFFQSGSVKGAYCTVTPCPNCVRNLSSVLLDLSALFYRNQRKTNL